MVGALVLTVMFAAVAATVVGLVTGESVEDSTPWFNVVGVVAQDIALVVTAVAVAAITARPTGRDFGLRRTRLWPSVGWAALGLFAYFVFAAIYQVLVEPRAEQSVAETLGVNQGTALLVAAGFVIIVLAPVAEEFFFRAFFYRTLRNSLARRVGVPLGAVLAAVLVGALFGSIHIEPGRVAQTLPLVPVLAALGLMFCLVYEKTGSLFAVVGLHALINTIGFLAVAENSAPVALALGGAMIVACFLVPRFLPAR